MTTNQNLAFAWERTRYLRLRQQALAELHTQGIEPSDSEIEERVTTLLAR